MTASPDASGAVVVPAGMPIASCTSAISAASDSILAKKRSISVVLMSILFRVARYLAR